MHLSEAHFSNNKPFLHQATSVHFSLARMGCGMLLRVDHLHKAEEGRLAVKSQATGTKPSNAHLQAHLTAVCR